MDGSDSEWEYEYDEVETETFYVTLDLSSFSRHLSTSIPKVKDDAPANKASKAASKSTTELNAPTLDPRLAHATNNVPPASTEPPTDAALPPNASPGSLGTEKKDTIQILDLHTANPLISRNGQLFSCSWASTLGTDLFFAAPEQQQERAGTNPDSVPSPEKATQQPSPPLRSYPGVDLLGISRTRLSARPVEAVLRSQPLSQSAPSGTEAQATNDIAAKETPSARAGADASTNENNAPPIEIPLPAGASEVRKRQAVFLSRLMELKRARGETDEVTVTVSSKADADPEERRRGLAAGVPLASRSRGRPANRAQGRGPGRGRGERGGRTGRGRGNSSSQVGHESGIGHAAPSVDRTSEGRISALETGDVEMQDA